jgi:large subunit ribosomal protein L22
MEVKATQKYVRITPRKLRLVADAVRGKELLSINEALSVLNKRGAKVINETIRQAVANAVNNLGYSEQQLSLKALLIDEGPTYKRFLAGGRGRAKPYQKRSSHVTAVLNVAVAEKSAPAKVEAKTETKAVAAEAVKAEKPAAKKPAVKKAAAKKAPAKKAAAKKAQEK